jgi:hypothetical protein
VTGGFSRRAQLHEVSYVICKLLYKQAKQMMYQYFTDTNLINQTKQCVMVVPVFPDVEKEEELSVA